MAEVLLKHHVTPVGGSFDIIVAVAKKLLPVAAVLLVLTLIILPLIATREFSFMLDKNRVAMSHDRLQLVRPVYQGSDSSGHRFVIEAVRAVQRTSADPTVELQGLHAKLDSDNGPATVDAPMGAYNLKTEQLAVAGTLDLSRADGYHFETRAAVVDLKTRMASSSSGVTGITPLGTLNARKFEVNVDTGAAVFSGGTHVHMGGRG